MPAWPTDLPYFRDLGVARRSGPQGAVRRSQMEVGPEKVRRLTSAAPKNASGRIPRLTPSELQAFETFFEQTLGAGALSFTAFDEVECVERTYRFLDSYEVRRVGAKFSITAELEILP